MSIWRGLFRLWVVASVLWALFVGALMFQEMTNPWLPPKYFMLGVGMDLHSLEPAGATQGDTSGYSRAQFPNNVEVFVSRGIPPATVSEWDPRFVREHVAPREAERSTRRSAAIDRFAAMTLLPALGFLLLGFALRWVVRGFRPRFSGQKPDP